MYKAKFNGTSLVKALKYKREYKKKRKEKALVNRSGKTDVNTMDSGKKENETEKAYSLRMVMFCILVFLLMVVMSSHLIVDICDILLLIHNF